MELYDFDSSGVFIGQRDADICQITGNPILRVNSTAIKPPKIKEGSIAVWTGEKWGVFTPEPIPGATIDELRETMFLTRLDAKIRLMELDLYTQINDVIMAMPDCFLKIKWTEADLFKRLDVDLCEFLHGLGMTDEQIDELFIK